MCTIAHPCLDVQTSEQPQPSVPPWFAETVLIAGYLRAHGLLAALTQQVRLVRGRFGRYEAIDFVAVLVGYALSGERTLQAYYERLSAFATPFMALFERQALPHRATLSRFLAAVDGPCLEALRALVASSSFAPGWTQATMGGVWDWQARRYLVIDVDATREAARQRALPASEQLPAYRRRLDAVCGPGYRGRRRGEVVRTRTTVLQMHTCQWLGTYGGRGNGDYRGELGAGLRAITAYLRAFDLPPTAGIVRVDGQYGDASVIAQILGMGLHVLVRGRGYTLLDDPWVQHVLAGPPLTTVTTPESGVTLELFDLLGVPLCPDIPAEAVQRCRALLTRRRWDGEVVAVGKRVGEWVYELFITTLPPEGFLAVDLLDLYHGRGAFEGTLADEDVEGDPDRWCSHAADGQELWQVIWQWIWNLRLLLGQQLPAAPALRSAAWSSPTSPAPLGAPGPQTVGWSEEHGDGPGASDNTAAAPDDSAAGYGPLVWSGQRGRASGRLSGAAFALRADGQLACPAGALLWLAETRQENAYTQRLIYQASAHDCAGCALRADCLGRSARGTRARRVSARRRRLVCAEPATSITQSPVPAAVPAAPTAQAIHWSDLPARALRRGWMAHWRSQAVEMNVLPDSPPPMARVPRARRIHQRLDWEERLRRNARGARIVAQIRVAGVPDPLARMMDASLHQ